MRPFTTVAVTRWLGAAAGCVMIAAGLAACSDSAPTGKVHFVVSPEPSLQSDPVSVTLDGLAKGAAVTVEATAHDANDKDWTSSARYAATATGAVSMKQPSLGGSYTGVNPMGLFEFMAPSAGNSETAFAASHGNFTVKLTAVVDGKDVAAASVVRQGSFSVGVTEKDYRPTAGGLYANMFLPKATTAKTSLHPAVLAFGGSEGGVSNSIAVSAQLAAHGYPTLDLAYFAEPGLPAHLANIPLEYFAKALALLRTEPGVDPKHVLVMGQSRGGEAALLLGATYPNLTDGVIAGVPSAYVNGAYISGESPSATPAWTLHGKPVTHLSELQQSIAFEGTAVNAPAAEIAVEKIRGPILLTCGGEDGIWSSCTFTADIVARLKAHHFAYPVTSLRYPKAGHYGGEFNGYYPTTQQNLASDPEDDTPGGTVAGTQLAWANNTQHLLALLATQH